MIDLFALEEYKENNRIEAKKSQGGLPESLWETYSAFANTLGGIILLGVIERENKSLQAVGVKNATALVTELWKRLNDMKTTNINILSRKQISVERIDDKEIIVIEVPKANRLDKPVYIGDNPLYGSYRRNGEGDYRCSKEEVESMKRDATIKSLDMKMLLGLDASSFNYNTLKAYRERLFDLRPSSNLNALSDTDFLTRLGALTVGENGDVRPTVAGLLTFGKYEIIKKEFKLYETCYGYSISGDMSVPLTVFKGNLYDFYCYVEEKLTQGIKGKKQQGLSDDLREPVKRSFSEALANTIIHADYFAPGGVKIIRSKDSVVFINAGSFRVDVNGAKKGEVRDTRNTLIEKFFNLINVGEGLGKGLARIFSVWENAGWLPPRICESFDPDLITIELKMQKSKSAIEGLDTSSSVAEQAIQVLAVIEWLTEKVYCSTGDVTRLLGVSKRRAEKIMDELVVTDVVVYDTDKNVYKLKR